MKRFFTNNPLAIILILYMAYQSYSSGQFKDPMDWFMGKMMIMPAILIAISFHEFAHAKVAVMLGDDTPRLQGRLTINPIAHMDPIGFIALIFIGFGWGRPVQVNPMNFKKMRRDNLLVDIAGVLTNLILAIVFAGVLKLVIGNYVINPEIMGIVIEMVVAIIQINIVLMVFNLLPVPPLDGFGIVTEIFNLRNKEIYYKIYNNGFIILMFLIIFNITDFILSPSVSFIFGLLIKIFNI